MSEENPAVVLVHGAFAESASWNAVVERLRARSFDVTAAANPLRGRAGDAAYVRSVVAGIGRPVVLVGHSYGGMVVTEAAAGNDAVIGLTYVGAFAPEHGESAFELAGKFPGSTLGAALVANTLSTGANDLTIAKESFPPAVRGRRTGRHGRRHGRDPAARHRRRPHHRPADRHTGLADDPVLVRVRQRGPQHPGRAVPFHGGARGIARNERDRGRIARTERVVPGRRGGVDPADRGCGRLRTGVTGRRLRSSQRMRMPCSRDRHRRRSSGARPPSSSSEKEAPCSTTPTTGHGDPSPTAPPAPARTGTDSDGDDRHDDPTNRWPLHGDPTRLVAAAAVLRAGDAEQIFGARFPGEFVMSSLARSARGHRPRKCSRAHRPRSRRGVSGDRDRRARPRLRSAEWGGAMTATTSAPQVVDEAVRSC